MTTPASTPVSPSIEPWDKDAVGRGAWSRQGGATPWLEQTVAPIPNVGSHWVRRKQVALPVGKTDAYRAVNGAVLALQRLLNKAGTTPPLDEDGWFGAGTAAAVKRFQAAAGLIVDGSAGPRTVKALLAPYVRDAAIRANVPADALSGFAGWEGGWDLGAVGVSGWDHGLFQINLDANAHGSTVSWSQAMDPLFALDWTARSLAGAYAWLSPYAAKSGANLGFCAIANHNSPALALQWAREGRPPYVEGRVIQIDTYVARVLAAA